MSRQITNDHLWTDDEVQYKLSRGQHREVKLNLAEFSGKQPEEIAPEQHMLQLDQDIFEHVNGLELTQLRSDLSKNELDLTGDTVVLKKRLAQHLQDIRDVNSND